jgi:hypothetical protein
LQGAVPPLYIGAGGKGGHLGGRAASPRSTAPGGAPPQTLAAPCGLATKLWGRPTYGPALPLGTCLWARPMVPLALPGGSGKFWSPPMLSGVYFIPSGTFTVSQFYLVFSETLPVSPKHFRFSLRNIFTVSKTFPVTFSHAPNPSSTQQIDDP